MNSKSQGQQNDRNLMNTNQMNQEQQNGFLQGASQNSPAQSPSQNQQILNQNVQQQQQSSILLLNQQQPDNLQSAMQANKIQSQASNQQQPNSQQSPWPYQAQWPQVALGLANMPGGSKEIYPLQILNNSTNLSIANSQQQQQQQPNQMQISSQVSNNFHSNNSDQQANVQVNSKQTQLMQLLNGNNLHIMPNFLTAQQNFPTVSPTQQQFQKLIGDQILKQQQQMYKSIQKKNNRDMEAEGKMVSEHGSDQQAGLNLENQNKIQALSMKNNFKQKSDLEKLNQKINQNDFENDEDNNDEEEDICLVLNKATIIQQKDIRLNQNQKESQQSIKSRKKCKNKRQREEIIEINEELDAQIEDQKQNKFQEQNIPAYYKNILHDNDEDDDDDDDEEEDDENDDDNFEDVDDDDEEDEDDDDNEDDDDDDNDNENDDDDNENDEDQQNVKEIKDYQQFQEVNKLYSEQQKYPKNKAIGKVKVKKDNLLEDLFQEESENSQRQKIKRNMIKAQIMKAHQRNLEQFLLRHSENFGIKPAIKKSPIQKQKKSEQVIKSIKKDNSNSKSYDSGFQASQKEIIPNFPLNAEQQAANSQQYLNDPILQLQLITNQIPPISQNSEANARNRQLQMNQNEIQQSQPQYQNSNSSYTNQAIQQYLQQFQLRTPQNPQLFNLAAGFLNSNQAQNIPSLPPTNAQGSNQIASQQNLQMNQNPQTINTDRSDYDGRIQSQLPLSQLNMQQNQQPPSLPFSFNLQQVTQKAVLNNNQQQQHPQFHSSNFQFNIQQFQQLINQNHSNVQRIPVANTQFFSMPQNNEIYRGSNYRLINGLLPTQQSGIEGELPLETHNQPVQGSARVTSQQQQQIVSQVVAQQSQQQQNQIQQQQQQQQNQQQPQQQIQFQQPSNQNNNNYSGANRSQVQKQNHLPPEVKSKYYTYRQNQHPQDYDQSEPYMKVTVMKTNQDNTNQNNVYFITPKGMVKSKKNTATDDIIIGRQESAKQNESFQNGEPNEIHPNDIVLPPTDRAISRIHCKIVYKYGFRIPRLPPYDFQLFLGAIKRNSFLPNIQQRVPDVVLRLIWKFVRPKNSFYIVDIGSAQGTFIKIRYEKSQVIEKGQVFLIGAETQFHILEVNHNHSMQKDEGREDNEVMRNENSNNMIADENDFMNFLLYEKKQNTTIHGLTAEEQQKLEALNNQQDNDLQNNTTWLVDSKKNFRPYVKLKVNSTQVSNHLFVYSQQALEQGFKIGRSQECTIQININTISRKQSRIYYSKGKWQLKDGDMTRESANGTWISLNDYREKSESRIESDQKEIEDGSEIKISDSILKIEICNNNVKKVKPKYSFNLDNLDDQMEVEQENSNNERPDLDTTS